MPLFLKQKRFRRKKRLKCSPDNKHCMTVLRPMLLIRIKKRSLDRKWDSRTDQRMSVFDTNNCGRWNETRPQNEKLSKLLIGQFFCLEKQMNFSWLPKTFSFYQSRTVVFRIFRSRLLNSEQKKMDLNQKFEWSRTSEQVVRLFRQIALTEFKLL